MRRPLVFVLCLLLCAPVMMSGAQADEASFLWEAQVGGDGTTLPAAMAPAFDGGVFVVGTTNSDAGDFGEGYGGLDGFILRVDANGNTLWTRRFGGSDDDELTAIVQTTDGGCLALGTTLSADGDARASRGGTDAWLIRLDARGETLWSKTLGGSLDDELTMLDVTEDGDFFACGRSRSRNGDLGANFGGWDAWATMLSGDDGKPVWTYRYGNAGDDRFTSAVMIHEGWLLLGEASEEAGTDENDEVTYVSRPIAQMLSIEGEPLWEEPLMLGEAGNSRLTRAIEVESGWLLAGEISTRTALMFTPQGGADIWLLSLRQNGTVAWQRAFGGTRDERINTLQALPDNGYLLLGETDSNDGQVFGAHGASGSDVWLVHVSASGGLLWQQTLGGSALSTATGLLVHEDGRLIVLGTTNAQDGDIGRHTSWTTGFVAVLAPNGTLLKTYITHPEDNCTMVQMLTDEGAVYLLGSLRATGIADNAASIWLARLDLDTLATE